MADHRYTRVDIWFVYTCEISEMLSVAVRQMHVRLKSHVNERN